MASGTDSLLDRDGVSISTLPDRTDELSLLQQGPQRRITIWKDVVEECAATDAVIAHYFRSAGVLLVDFENGGKDD